MTPKSTQDHADPIAHIQKLEELIRSLVGVLASQNIPMGPKVQAMLHGLPLSAPPTRESDDMSDGADSMDQYLGDYTGDNVHQPAPCEFRDDSFVEEPAKKPRTALGPSDGTVWASVDTLPFKHLAWGRVKGDGNCFWRSVAQLLGRDWVTLKKEVLATSPSPSEYLDELLSDLPLRTTMPMSKLWGKKTAGAPKLLRRFSLAPRRSPVKSGKTSRLGFPAYSSG